MLDTRLKALLLKSEFASGWGQTGLVVINGQKVFVKRIPVTVLDMANAYSTKNLYRIPAWYNYGVGSAGFGAFRELAAHLKTTNWVRDGTFSGFPLLHYHRILTSDERGPDTSNLREYVDYWNVSKTIQSYMDGRGDCKHQLLISLEFLTPLID